MTATVKLRGVSKRFGEVVAVNKVSLEVRGGEVFGVLGPSGAGKSTLLRIIDLLERPDEGEVSIHGKNAPYNSRLALGIRATMGMVLQKPVVLNRSVANNLAYSLRIRGVEDEAIKDMVKAELAKIGLTARKHKNARTLSGGEMQRLSFARATIYDPDILLLDEFSANLDPRNVSLLENAVKRYMAEEPGRTVIIVTHNIFQARRICDRVALMLDGAIIEVADKSTFFEGPADSRTAAFVKGELVY